MTEKRRKENSHSLSISSVGSNQYPYHEMSIWEENFEFYESSYVQLLYEVVTDAYTDAGKKFDLDFWEKFNSEFNDRVMENFTCVQMISEGKRIRERWFAYKRKESGTAFSHKTRKQLKKIFPPVVKFPSIGKISRSCSRITTNRSSSCSRVSIECQFSEHFLNSAGNWLSQMFNDRKINAEEYVASLRVLNRDPHFLKAFARIRNDDLRLDYAKNLVNWIK